MAKIKEGDRVKHATAVGWTGRVQKINEFGIYVSWNGNVDIHYESELVVI